jgi:hypothetical protein
MSSRKPEGVMDLPAILTLATTGNAGGGESHRCETRGTCPRGQPA